MIEINRLTKIYGGSKSKALDSVSLTIPIGIYGLIGRNGAGKTTLMRILAAICDQTEGEILFDGKDLATNKELYRSSLGYLPQSTALMPRLNITEFLEYVCILKKIRDKNRRKELINTVTDLVGLGSERKKLLGHYSGGMLRRAGIAQALIGDPKLLIIDEPTTGLDPEERIKFLNLLSQIASDRTIIFSTHIISDIEQLCNNICILDKGHVKYAGSKKGLLSATEGRLFEHSGPFDTTELKAGTVITSVTHLYGKPVIRYVSDTPFSDNSIPVKPSLEDAYMFLSGGIKN